MSCLNVYKKAHHVLGDRLSGLGFRSSIFGAADADRSEVKGCRRVTKKQNKRKNSHTDTIDNTWDANLQKSDRKTGAKN